ncbi:MAG: CinA family protein [Deltaproteobacteria bacterium]|nr:CinA family protein [Deltaproteobacteria bacterium]
MAVTELAETLARLKLTVTAAESLTGGLFQNRLCACERASEIYPGGFITYSPEAKTRLLGVSPEILRKKGTVSEETAIAMAKACREALRTDLGLSLTGVGGPGPSEGSAPGTVWIGVADCDSVFARPFLFEGKPQEVLDQAVNTAADLLRAYALDNRDRLAC